MVTALKIVGRREGLETLGMLKRCSGTRRRFSLLTACAVAALFPWALQAQTVISTATTAPVTLTGQSLTVLGPNGSILVPSSLPYPAVTVRNSPTASTLTVSGSLASGGGTSFDALATILVQSGGRLNLDLQSDSSITARYSDSADTSAIVVAQGGTITFANPILGTIIAGTQLDGIRLPPEGIHAVNIEGTLASDISIGASGRLYGEGNGIVIAAQTFARTITNAGSVVIASFSGGGEGNNNSHAAIRLASSGMIVNSGIITNLEDLDQGSFNGQVSPPTRFGVVFFDPAFYDTALTPTAMTGTVLNTGTIRSINGVANLSSVGTLEVGQGATGSIARPSGTTRGQSGARAAIYSEGDLRLGGIATQTIGGASVPVFDPGATFLGTVEGFTGIWAAGRLIGDTTLNATISGLATGLRLGELASTLTNQGTISGRRSSGSTSERNGGIIITTSSAGARIVNAAGATIEARFGFKPTSGADRAEKVYAIYSGAGALDIENAGTISSQGATGSTAVGGNGIGISGGSGTILNRTGGQIDAYRSAILISGGAVTNEVGAVIRASTEDGINNFGAALNSLTVENRGTITALTNAVFSESSVTANNWTGAVIGTSATISAVRAWCPRNPSLGFRWEGSCSSVCLRHRRGKIPCA